MTTAALADLVRVTLRRHAMLAGGERVLVGVSGGADSVALLGALLALAPVLSLELHVVHVDHQLRADSAEDAAFVEQLGRRLDVPVAVERVRVAPGASLEAAARAARHGALEIARARLGATRVALGHTADDQAETVLMRLLEGAGVRGLAAIPPVRGSIIRPLIETRRRDVEAALRAAGLPWVEDPTNRDPKFLRNRIRHEVLPLLASYHGDVVVALGRTAALAREAITAMDRLAEHELQRLATVETDGALTLSLAGLRALPSSIAPDVLRQAAARLGGTAPLRAWAHRGLTRMVAVPPPRRPFRLGGVVVEVSAGRVRLGRTRPAPLVSRTLAVPGRVDLPEIGRVFEASVVAAAGYQVPRARGVVAFDADLVPTTLTIRGRHRGDRVVTMAQGERRLKTLFIAAKIPRWQRTSIPVIEVAGEILWVAGIRRARLAPLTASTRRVLQLELR